MSAATIQPLDGRHPVIVDPSEIRPSDWMADCGRLRLVVSVESVPDPVAPGTLIRFADVLNNDRFATLTVPGAVKVTVWRTPTRERGTRRV